MGDRGRVGAGEYAERVNAAAQLLEGGVPSADAALQLSARFAVSLRQARRYVDWSGPASVDSARVLPSADLRA